MKFETLRIQIFGDLFDAVAILVAHVRYLFSVGFFCGKINVCFSFNLIWTFEGVNEQVTGTWQNLKTILRKRTKET